MSFIEWTGLYTLSSVLRRQIYYPRTIMAGNYTVYPNLYVMLVAPAGAIRKSTTTANAERFLDRIEGVTIASSAISASALVAILAASKDAPIRSKDGSVSIMSSEFASFIAISKDTMYDLLTDLYDGKVKHDMVTRLHGHENIKHPCVNLLAATTPAWVAGNMPAHVLGGGFASRVIFVNENQLRQRMLFYKHRPEYDEMDSKLTRDLEHIATLKGEVSFESEALMEKIDRWYQEEAPKWGGDTKTEGYFNRKHVHTLKLMAILSAAERDDLVVTETHFAMAKALLAATETRLPKVFSAVGRNPHASTTEQVLTFIQAKGPVTRAQIMAQAYSDVDARRLTEILDTLQMMGVVEFKMGSWRAK